MKSRGKIYDVLEGMEDYARNQQDYTCNMPLKRHDTPRRKAWLVVTWNGYGSSFTYVFDAHPVAYEITRAAAVRHVSEANHD